MEHLNNAGVGGSGVLSVAQSFEIVSRSVQEALQRQKHEAVQETSRAFEVIFEEKLNRLAQRMDERDATLAEQMEQRVARLGERMEEHDARLAERMEERDARLAERMEERDARFTGQMEERVETLTDRVEERVATLAGRMEERVARLAGQMEERVATLAEQVEERGASLAERMEERVARLAGQMEERVVTLAERMEERVATSAERMEQQVIQRAESLLQQLEGKCPPAPFTVPYTSSSSPSPNKRPSNESSKTPSASISSPQPCDLLSVSSTARTSSASPSPLAPSPAVPSSTSSTGSAPSQPSIPAKGEELYKAAKAGSVKDVERLLNEGANANHRDAGGWTPLVWAAFYGYADVVSLLLERGADVNAGDGWSGGTALHWASANDHSGRCVELLIDGGAHVQHRNRWRQTALHDAAAKGNETAVRLLIAAGASNTIQDEDGKVPSDNARNLVILEMLLSSSRQPSP